MVFDYGIVRDALIPNESVFPHPFYACYMDIAEPMKCLEEWNIINISLAIREKPEWQRKYKDEIIVAKWKAELEEQFKEKSDYFDKVWTYVLKELEWYDSLGKNFPVFQDNGFKVAFDDKIAYSDKAVLEKAKSLLKKDVENFFEQEFADGPDYHPGSDNKVIDIVHPSLYPLKYGTTPYYATKDSDLSIIEFNEKEIKIKYGVERWGVSKNYQWLPALMSWSKNPYNSKRYVFQSYINNLHPKYESLYHTIEDIFNCAIPGLNYVLSRYKSDPIIRIPWSDYSWYTKEWEKIEGDFWERTKAEKELWDEYDEFVKQKIDYLKVPSIEFKKHHPVDYTFDLRKRFPYLKVIVKLAIIELKPENPTYAGGSWHVEGTINEDIVATILYYYDTKNIEDSRLSFKATYEDPTYEQNDSVGLEKVFGLKDEDKVSKKIGEIACQEDRLLIFPNGYQHHVDPFELKDKNNKGHRKILCMFLVDPYNKAVVTTAQVPPQQKTWHEQQKIDEPLNEEKRKKEEEEAKKQKYYRSPDKWDMFQFFKHTWRLDINSLKESINSSSDNELNYPKSLENAMKDREKLMEERKSEAADEEEAFTREFSLCEH